MLLCLVSLRRQNNYPSYNFVQLQVYAGQTKYTRGKKSEGGVFQKNTKVRENFFTSVSLTGSVAFQKSDLKQLNNFLEP
jgi:hypothetical protein